jgi:hypothetical protein
MEKKDGGMYHATGPIRYEYDGLQRKGKVEDARTRYRILRTSLQPIGMKDTQADRLNYGELLSISSRMIPFQWSRTVVEIHAFPASAIVSAKNSLAGRCP